MKEIIEKIKERIAKGETLIRDNEVSYDLLKMTNPKADSNEQLKNEMHALNLLVKTNKEALDWVLKIIDERYEDGKMPGVNCCQKLVEVPTPEEVKPEIVKGRTKPHVHETGTYEQQLEREKQKSITDKQFQARQQEKVAKLVNDIKLTVEHLPLTGDLNMVSDAILMLLDVGFTLKEVEFQKVVVGLKQILRGIEAFYHPQIPMLVEGKMYIVRKREQNTEYEEFFKMHVIELTEHHMFIVDVDSEFEIRMSYEEFYNEFEILELCK